MSGILDFAMQQQTLENWCWAAVAASVTTYFQRVDPADVASQCQIVQGCLAAQTPVGAPDCRNEACNQTFYLEKALGAVHHLDGSAFSLYPTYDSIASVIMNRRTPIGVRLARGAFGHFVLIVGFDDDNGAQDLFVADPLYSPSQYSYRIPYNTLCRQADGTVWTHTYPIK